MNGIGRTVAFAGLASYAPFRSEFDPAPELVGHDDFNGRILYRCRVMYCILKNFNYHFAGFVHYFIIQFNVRLSKI